MTYDPCYPFSYGQETTAKKRGVITSVVQEELKDIFEDSVIYTP